MNAVWPKLTMLQDQWANVCDDEVEEAREHNLKVLRNIAAFHGADREAVSISVINVYQAQMASFNGNSKSEKILLR